MVTQVYGYNPNTIKAHFQRLVQAGILLPKGKGKGRSYVVVSPPAGDKPSANIAAARPRAATNVR